MTTADSEDTLPIADKVRFWEEQDKINQELIPRVIRQHELLTAHIADHEKLPLVAANAISEALTEALQQQQEQYEAALAGVKAESGRATPSTPDRVGGRADRAGSADATTCQ